MARLHTGRHKVLAAYRSYHGATAGAIALTGDPRRWPSEPGMTGVVHFWGPYPYRSRVPRQHARRRSASGRCRTCATRSSSRGRTPSRRSSWRPSSAPTASWCRRTGYLAGVRALCDEYGIVLIADEVMAGFGRCGEWFAVDHWGVTPDLITFAKGVNSGLRPARRCASSPTRSRRRFADRPYPGGLTYSGHPLACASAVASIRSSTRRGHRRARPRARRRRHRARAARRWPQRHPSVGEVRGLGVFWAVELVRDRETREPLVPFNAGGADAAPMNEFAAACKAAGPVAVHPLQPHARRAAVHDDRRRGPRGPRHPRRGARRRRPLLRRLTDCIAGSGCEPLIPFRFWKLLRIPLSSVRCMCQGPRNGHGEGLSMSGFEEYTQTKHVSSCLD